MAAAPTPQLNLRLKPDLRATLEAAAFVRGVSSTQLAVAVLEPAIRGFAEEPAVRKAREARAEHEASEAGTLRHLDDKRRGNAPGSDGDGS